MIDEKYYVSQKGCKYILSPKRGKWTTINPEFASTLTAVGQSNWIGSFISDNIDHIERDSKTKGDAHKSYNEEWRCLLC